MWDATNKKGEEDSRLLNPRARVLQPINNPPHLQQDFQEKMDYQNQKYGYQNGNTPYDDASNNGANYRHNRKEEIPDVKRNITDGKMPQLEDLDLAYQIKNPDGQAHLVQESLDYFDNIEEKKVTSFLENLQNGKFVGISNQAIKEKEREEFDGDDKQEIKDQFSTDMYKMIKNINIILFQMLYFFQGIFMGYCLMHSVMLYQEKDSAEGIEFYATSGLRLAQSMQLLGTVCLVGALHLYYQSVKNVYFVCYALIIIAHPWAARLSASVNNLSADNLNSYYDYYKVFTLLVTIFSLFGWILSITNVKSPIDYTLLQQEADIIDDSDDELDD